MVRYWFHKIGMHVEHMVSFMPSLVKRICGNSRRFAGKETLSVPQQSHGFSKNKKDLFMHCCAVMSILETQAFLKDFHT